MLSVMIFCSVTREPVYTGIEMDERSFAKMPKVFCRTACPACGREHLWTNREAWLTTGGWLVAPEWTSEAAMPLKQVA
jgi:hypothetical protein